ncbi:unnamed protein product [Symbiodinium necroappetens]|uniref:Uncharacterized protein n=1 Tax=Symbiodinium necroappetens TaxID=1628268 RepID=A0A812NNT8_9DINO|nr:unnamed protein product [Symbiodinium necroappetens]
MHDLGQERRSRERQQQIRSAWHGPWAEQSLLAAERLLAKAFHLQRPEWLNETYYKRHIGGSHGGPAMT